MSKPICRIFGSRASAWRSVPDTQLPASSTCAPSERGNSSYQELNRARSRCTSRRSGGEGETSSRSGCAASAACTAGVSPADNRSSLDLPVSRNPAAASISA